MTAAYNSLATTAAIIAAARSSRSIPRLSPASFVGMLPQALESLGGGIDEKFALDERWHLQNRAGDPRRLGSLPALVQQVRSQHQSRRLQLSLHGRRKHRSRRPRSGAWVRCL